MNPNPQEMPFACTNEWCDVRHEQICRNCWARLDGDLQAQFIVRMQSPYAPAVSFHSNLCFAKVFEVAPDEDASKFTTVAAARNTMREYGLSPKRAAIHRFQKTFLTADCTDNTDGKRQPHPYSKTVSPLIR
jgi:hypothetical protein